jgi:hypothetical protein
MVPDASQGTVRLHVICERDVGLFSLVQQVAAHVVWALHEGRAPVAYFRDRTCYWTPDGYRGADTVWEYYFEPLLREYPAARIPRHVRAAIATRPPSPFEVGYYADARTFVSSHFGDHPDIQAASLVIPYQWDDPSPELRRRAATVLREYARPREYVLDQVERFYATHMRDQHVIGMHIRGTDAVSHKEVRPHRHGSLDWSRYLATAAELLRARPSARILVATDAQDSLEQARAAFGERVLAYESLRHQRGEAAGAGPTGWIMPAYIAGDRAAAARNGEEAIIEYLLLARCSHLIHNGSSLARTVLLHAPDLPQTNTHTRRAGVGAAADGGAVATRPASHFRRRLWERAEARREPAVAPATGAPPPVVAPDVIRRVKEEKAARRTSSATYREHSEVAFLVHSFNRAENIEQLHDGLRRLGDHELIVCEDGSIDGSHEKWTLLLDRPNDFLIRSNDLHEIRVLERAIRYASADVVCLVQDDDRIPGDADWLAAALECFRAHPDLAILGGFMGFRGFHPDADKVERMWGPAPFQFVHHVNIGPFFIRKRSYEALGGWDHSFSRVGEPGICFDNELCLRAWVGGYQVGYRFVPFKGPPGHYALDGGTILFSGTARRRNQLRNQRAIFEMYASHAQRIDALVDAANRSLAPTAVTGPSGASETAAGPR